jgi:transposase InsO family protein
LRRWRAEQGAGKLAPELRGPRPFRTSPAFLRALVECVEEYTLMGVRALHRALPGIPRRWLEWLAARVEERHERRAWRGELVWMRAGTVWTMDHTELEAPIDGQLWFLFVVRDLASGRVLTASPTRSTDHGPVVQELERLFQFHGAPLVLKSDNGSGLVHRDVRQLLERWGVTSLRSPPLTPTYNGAVEAGMGSLKARIAAIAAQHGRATAWTHDDLDAALCAQRACGAPRGATASPDEAWRARVSIPPEERQRFLEALEVARESLLRDSPPSPIIERKAVRNVLTELTYLIIRRP